MYAYSGYNQIRMDPLDASKTAFMTNTKNYHYEVMSFGLRNAGATFQRQMDSMFVAQIGRNLEVYIDDLVVKTPENAAHTTDLDEIFLQVRKFNMRLNPAKCTFGVQAGKFLTHQSRHRGQPRQMSSHHQHEKSLQHKRSSATNREAGRPVQIFIVRRRQGFRLICFHQEKIKI